MSATIYHEYLKKETQKYKERLKNGTAVKRVMKGRRPPPPPGSARGQFRGNGKVRYEKLLDLGVAPEEAKELARSGQESRKIIDQHRLAFNAEVKGLVEFEEGDGPNQININAIFKFERQRDILRRLLQQGLQLDEAIPLAREAGENEEPFDRVTARRFVKQQLGQVRASTAELKIRGGAAKRRFRVLVSKGINVEKARELCQKPFETKQAIFALRGRILEPKPDYTKTNKTWRRSDTTTTPSTTSAPNATTTTTTTTTATSTASNQRTATNVRRQPTTASSQRSATNVTRQPTTTTTTSRYRNETVTRPPQTSDMPHSVTPNNQRSTYARGANMQQQQQQQFMPTPSDCYFNAGFDAPSTSTSSSLFASISNVLQPPPQQQQMMMDNNNNIKLAVLSPDYPVSIWPTDMLKGIQRFIFEAAHNDGVDLSSSAGVTCSFRPGWIAYTVSDLRTAQWFKARVPNLRPNDVYLAVVNEDEVPRSEIFVAYIPEQRDLPTEDLLTIIGVQNNGLRTNDWNVVNRVQRGPMLELNIILDPFSAKLLKFNNYSITYGRLSACIKPRDAVGLPTAAVGPSSSRNVYGRGSSGGSGGGFDNARGGRERERGGREMERGGGRGNERDGGRGKERGGVQRRDDVREKMAYKRTARNDGRRRF